MPSEDLQTFMQFNDDETAGGFVGLSLGYVLAYLKKTLPDGTRMHVYPPGEQKHGKRILVIGLISLIVWLFLNLSGEGWIPGMRPL